MCRTPSSAPSAPCFMMLLRLSRRSSGRRLPPYLFLLHPYARERKKRGQEERPIHSCSNRELIYAGSLVKHPFGSAMPYHTLKLIRHRQEEPSPLHSIMRVTIAERRWTTKHPV